MIVAVYVSCSSFVLVCLLRSGAARRTIKRTFFTVLFYIYFFALYPFPSFFTGRGDYLMCEFVSSK